VDAKGTRHHGRASHGHAPGNQAQEIISEVRLCDRDRAYRMTELVCGVAYSEGVGASRAVRLISYKKCLIKLE
jgi:hypothetical protein